MKFEFVGATVFLLFFSASACRESSYPGVTTIKIEGRLLTATGEMATGGQVQLTSMVTGAVVETHEVADGLILLRAPRDGHHRLHANADGHQPASVPLIFSRETDATLKLDLILSPYRGMNSAALLDAEISGSNARKLPVLVTSDAVLMKAFNCEREFVGVANLRQASPLGTTGHHSMSQATHQVCEALHDRATPEVLRSYLAARILDSGSDVFPDGERHTAIRVLPSDSPFWSMLTPTISQLDADAHGDVLVALHIGHIDDVVRSLALIPFISKARAEGNISLWRGLYAELLTFREGSPGLQSLFQEFDPEGRINIGRSVPNFEMRLVESRLDESTSVSQYSFLGSYYLIDFWATWCVPCVSEMPVLHKAWSRHMENNFHILSVSLDRSLASVLAFRQNEFEMPWLHSFQEMGFSSRIAQLFEVKSIPRPILVDPEGVIIATGSDLRGYRLFSTLNKFLLPDEPTKAEIDR